MPLHSGTRLGPYEILSPIGAGGMGQVYKARDTRLERTVAIKLIQPHAAADPEFRERFEREARAISSLDHPHICTLYDVGHEAVGGTDYLVMQYLEGETLADRLARTGRPASDPHRPASSSGEVTLSTIARGPIPLDTVLRYAAEIAHALDAAHRRQIVHRDLKPGNVMLTKSGTKLLDFGLAKLAAAPVSVGGVPVDATRTSPPGMSASPLTGQSALLGTLYYMSPEQLEGREVDARSDIFSFGALLYEMLTGRRAFARESHAGVIAAIIADDAPALGALADAKTSLPVVARRALERLVHKCLAKNPDDRWQSAADLAAELTWINEERLRGIEEPVADRAPGPVPVPRVRERWWKAATIVTVLALLATAWAWYQAPPPSPEPVTFTIEAPDGETFVGGPGLLTVSNDGRRVAFAASDASGTRRIWVRSFASLIPQRLDRSDGAIQLAWSPDDRFIVYAGATTAEPIRKIDVSGGSAMTLGTGGGRPSWNREGVILFSGGRSLQRVSAAGGQAALVTEIDPARDERNFFWPMFLPDGRRFIFCAVTADRSKSALVLGSLDSPERTHLVNVLSSVDYAKGHLFYQRDGTLMAHPFDADGGRLTGEPIALVEDVQFNASTGRGAFSVSPAGVLAYRKGGVLGGSEKSLAWFDRSGKLLGRIGGTGDYLFAELAPDGRRLVVTERGEQVARRWLSLVDVDRGVPTRFTVGDLDEFNPVWSPRGDSVVFNSIRQDKRGIYRRSAGGGATTDELLYESADEAGPEDISRDGQVLLFTMGTGPRQRLWAMPLTGDRKPFQVYSGSPTREGQARFSPDAKWIAYLAGDGSVPDVYIAPFPGDDRRIRVSTAGGWSPRWTADGKQLLYRADDDAVMSVDLTLVDGTLRPGTPQRLFVQRRAGRFQTNVSIDPRGERFVLVIPPEQQAEVRPTPITVVMNVEAMLQANPR